MYRNKTLPVTCDKRDVMITPKYGHYLGITRDDRYMTRHHLASYRDNFAILSMTFVSRNCTDHIWYIIVALLKSRCHLILRSSHSDGRLRVCSAYLGGIGPCPFSQTKSGLIKVKRKTFLAPSRKHLVTRGDFPIYEILNTPLLRCLT